MVRWLLHLSLSVSSDSATVAAASAGLRVLLATREGRAVQSDSLGEFAGLEAPFRKHDEAAGWVGGWVADLSLKCLSRVT